MSLYDKLHDLNRAELEDVLVYYDDYVYECMQYGCADREPVGVAEFIDNDYIFIKEDEKDSFEDNGGLYVEISFR